MDEGLIVGIAVLAVVTAAMALVLVHTIGYQRMIGTYHYRHGRHGIDVVIAKGSLSLYIDGELVKKRKALNVHICDFCYELCGVWIRARVDGRIGRQCVDVTADDVPLSLVGKEVD